MAEPYLLRLERVVKTYGSVRAVDGVSLSVRPGEYVVLVGPSGSGKTTLLQMVGGFVEPTEGTIWLDGKDVTQVPPSRRDTATVFQRYALFPHMRVLENVEFGLRMRGVPAAERRRRAREALELVGLQGLEHRWPSELSGGQQQRVALARAVVIRPRLLLLDEPLAALDAGLRLRMQMELKRYQTALGIAFLHVTHDQEEALSLADRVVLMHQGRVVDEGSPADVYQWPANRFSASFFGETNLLEGRVVAVEHDRVLVETPAGRVWSSRVHRGRRLELQEGDAVTIALRPERVALAGGPAAAGTAAGVNRIPVRVARAAYKGAFTLVEGYAAGGSQPFVIKVPGAAHGAGLLNEVEVAWEPEAAVVLPPEEGSLVDAHRRPDASDGRPVARLSGGPVLPAGAGRPH